jgi:hypothetical protein
MTPRLVVCCVLLLCAQYTVTAFSPPRLGVKQRMVSRGSSFAYDSQLLRASNLIRKEGRCSSLELSSKSIDSSSGGAHNNEEIKSGLNWKVMAPLGGLLLGALYVGSGKSPLGVVDASALVSSSIDKIADAGPYGYLYVNHARALFRGLYLCPMVVIFPIDCCIAKP